MRRFDTTRLIAILLLSSFPSALQADASVPVVSLTLSQCYELAVKQSEQLQLTQEEIIQSSARIREAAGSAMPYLKWNITDLIQDTSGVGGDSGGVGNTLTRPERSESKFVLNQPIFSGFREFSSISGFKADRRRIELNLARQSEQLIGAVAEAFYSVVLLETEKKDLSTLLRLTQERASELRSRLNLGKSRRSEIASQESQLSALESQLIDLQRQIMVSRDDLGFLIGRSVRGVLLVDVVPQPAPVGEEDDMTAAINNRSDVKAFQELVVAKRFALRAVKGLYWPRLGVTGDYYTHRPGFQSNIDWDLLFNLDVPIYQGGAVKAQSNEAASQIRQAELQLTLARRQAGIEISQARSNLNFSINATRTLQEAFEKAKLSYDLQVKEYRLGLVNNLEVLQAMNTMQQARQNLDSALLQSKLNWLRLKVATEEKL